MGKQMRNELVMFICVSCLNTLSFLLGHLTQRICCLWLIKYLQKHTGL